MNLNLTILKFFINKEKECINISNYKINSIDEKCFKNILPLKSIVLQSCEIKRIKNEFKNLNTLIKLDLSSNQIESLDATSFTGTDQLSLLNLSKNKINSLPLYIFKNLIHLNEIDLSGNNISDLDVSVFNNLKNLINLNVSNNNIKQLQSSFDKLTSLVTINFSWNLIEEIKDNLFKNLKKIHHIDLRGNKISRINRKTFSGLHKLTTIYMHSHNNKLTNRLELYLEDSVKYISFKDSFQNNLSLIIKKSINKNNEIYNELKSSILDLKVNKDKILNEFEFNKKHKLETIQSIIFLINSINNKENDLIKLIDQLKDIETVLNQHQINDMKIKNIPIFTKLNDIFNNNSGNKKKVDNSSTEADLLIEKYQLVQAFLFDQKSRIDKLVQEIQKYKRYTIHRNRLQNFTVKLSTFWIILHK
jgi:Leucine-rich repeat (LRR) protein